MKNSQSGMNCRCVIRALALLGYVLLLRNPATAEIHVLPVGVDPNSIVWETVERPAFMYFLPDGRLFTLSEMVEYMNGSPPLQGCGTTGGGPIVSIWASDGRRVFTSETLGLEEVALSPDGTLLAEWDSDSCCRSQNGHIRLYELATLRITRTYKAFKEALSDGTFSPDGRLFAAAIYRADEEGVNVKLYDVRSGRRKLALKTGEGSTRIAFSPDSKKLLVVEPSDSTSASLSLWDLSRSRRLWKTGVANDYGRISFSSDGHQIQYASDKVFALIAAQDGQVLESGPGRGEKPPLIDPTGLAAVIEDDSGAVSLRGLSTGKTALIFEAPPRLQQPVSTPVAPAHRPPWWKRMGRAFKALH